MQNWLSRIENRELDWLTFSHTDKTRPEPLRVRNGLGYQRDSRKYELEKLAKLALFCFLAAKTTQDIKQSDQGKHGDHQR